MNFIRVRENNRDTSKKGDEKESFFSKEITFFQKFSDKKKETFYNELYSLLHAGIDLKTGLEILGEGAKNTLEKDLIDHIRIELINGSKLSDAFKSSNKFTEYECYSVGIGEETGKLLVVLEELRAFFNQKVELKRQLKSIFAYPLFVLLVTFAVLYFMMNYVVPMFEDVFKQFGGELPTLTQKIVRFSEIFPMVSLITVLVLIGISLTMYFLKENTDYRKLTSIIILKIPFFGKLINKVYLTRFCQAMSLLTMAKTPLVDSIELTSKMIGFYPYEIALESIKEEIKEGKSLHASMSNFSIFTPKIISLVKISEETNQLDLIFSRLKQQFGNELEHQTKMLSKILEPMIILIIGGVVGVIMIAMYLPLFNLSNVIGQ